MQVNVIEHLFIRLGCVNKAHMVKINGAVAHGHDRVLRILNVRLFLDHLGNAARG